MSVGPCRTRTRFRGTSRNLIRGFVLAVACACVAGLPASAVQPPAPDDVDDRQPLPPDEPVRPAVAQRYQIPDPDRMIFRGARGKFGEQIGGIQDDKPLASEKDNGDEYRALTEIVQFLTDPRLNLTAAELEAHAIRYLTRDDLTYPTRWRYRLKLIRFDGVVTKYRKIPPTRAMLDSGVTELYEGWMIPAEENANRPIRFLFTKLPEGVPPPSVEAEWVPVEKWAQFAGYSFKWLAYPGPGADPNSPNAGGWLRAPLLIGISFTPVPEPPPVIELDRDLGLYNRIVDDAAIARGGDNWEEAEAWNRIILHARKFTPEQLGQASNKNRTFADLFKDIRRDYRLELVHFEGRLIRLRKVEPSTRLTEAGIESIYEGWIIPANEPSGNPICVVVSELPSGLEPQPVGKGLLNNWVAFDGYSFKLMRYESGDKDPNDQNKWKRAPLLIGRTINLLNDPNGNSVTYWKQFIPSILGGLLLLVVSGFVLSWWFRKGDRRARQEIEGVRNKNPFEA